MATSDQSKCSTDVNEDNRNACCSPCSDEGSYTAAIHYCVDCEMYFCGNCLKYHNKMPALKSHHVNDIESSVSTNGDCKIKNQGDVSTETVRCTIHQDKLIDTYCKDHDEVCCGTCAVVKHRRCSTESTAKASLAMQSNQDVNKCKDALTQVIIQLKEVKDKRTENIDRVGKQKLELIETIDKYEEKIIAKVKELANISRKEIRSKYEEHKTALEVDVEALDAAITTSTAYVDKLEQTGNESLLFSSVQTSKIVTRDGEMLLQAMLKEWKNMEIIFHVDGRLEKYVDEMKSFGLFGDDCDVKEYKATFQKNVTVKQYNEVDTVVYDMCLMDSGDLLVTDYNNYKLKRYSSDLQYKDEIQLSSYPVAVCKIDKQQVAVRICTKDVWIVFVGQSMEMTSSFTLAGIGWGMAYDAGTNEIFACEEDKVSIYSKTGGKLRTYGKNANGEPMFYKCRQITLSDNKQDIYVTDFSRGLTVLNKSGHLKMKVSLSDINDAFLLCLLPGHICLAGSRDSGRIIQIDQDGTNIGTLVDTKNKRTRTYCSVYDREHSRLLVGGYPSVISVYTTSAK